MNIVYVFDNVRTWIYTICRRRKCDGRDEGYVSEYPAKFDGCRLRPADYWGVCRFCREGRLFVVTVQNVIGGFREDAREDAERNAYANILF